MCAMHRSMGRLKMHVRLPDDWGKLCRWHWQRSEGHADLRRSPRGETRLLSRSWAAVSSLVLRRPRIPCQARTFSAQPCLLGGSSVLGSFWGQGAGVSPTTVPPGSVTEGCLTCE